MGGKNQVNQTTGYTFHIAYSEVPEITLLDVGVYNIISEFKKGNFMKNRFF